MCAGSHIEFHIGVLAQKDLNHTSGAFVSTKIVIGLSVVEMANQLLSAWKDSHWWMIGSDKELNHSESKHVICPNLSESPVYFLQKVLPNFEIDL